jgi:ribosomal protein L28
MKQVAPSQSKTRRRWLPNVHHKHFYSPLLRRRMRLAFTAKAMRCMDRRGGFDNYLLYSDPRTLGAGKAQELREQLWAALRELPEEEQAKHKALAPPVVLQHRAPKTPVDADDSKASDEALAALLEKISAVDTISSINIREARAAKALHRKQHRRLTLNKPTTTEHAEESSSSSN